MSDTLKKYWLVVAVIWGGALVLTWINVDTIAKFKRQQQRVETLRMDDTFLKSNFDKITRVLQDRAKLHKSIDSLQLEMIWLEDRLKMLAGVHRLSWDEMTADTNTAGFEHIDVQLKLKGGLQDAIMWLKQVRDQYPYLPITRLDLKPLDKAESFQIDAVLRFRFQLQSDAEQI